MMESPHLRLTMYKAKQNKSFTILMASDYERSNWKDTIIALTSKGNDVSLIL